MTFDELEAIMFRYYNSLPEPKKSYAVWWYSYGGIRDMVLEYHKLDQEYEDRFELKEKIKEVKGAASENGV